MTRFWLTAAVGGILVLGTLAIVGAQDPEAAADHDEPAASAEESQPIQFAHNIHAGQFQMDCMYCHFSAERSVDAGIPPVETCMGCHRVVQGRNNPEEVAKIHEYYNNGEPIPWKRIYKVSDHVMFPHLRHVAAGVTCQSCHGQVQQMGVLEEMAPEAQDLKMGWCITCHVEQGASRDCTVCHY